MRDVRKKDLLGQSSFSALTHLGGAEVLLAPVSENQKSALQVYFEQKGQVINVDEPFEDEAIRFMVDSLIVEGETQQEDSFKKAEVDLRANLFEGFKKINQSKTARQLMMMLPYKLPVELLSFSENNGDSSLGEESSSFFVLDQVKKIFIPINGFQGFKPKRLAIEFLHETGHILDNEGLRPFAPFNQVFKNKENQVITGIATSNFSDEEAYRLNLILEAEKQAVAYQMDWESASFFEKMGLILQGTGIGLSEAVLGWMGSSKQAPYRSLISLNHGVLYERKRLKNFLKNPFSFFKKQEKKKVEEAAKKEAIYEAFSSLLQPVERKKGLLGRYKSLSMLLLAGGVFVSGGSALLLPFVGGSALLSLAGCLKENYQKFQDRWQKSYQRTSLENMMQRSWQDQSTQKDFSIVLESLGQKYDQATKVSELKTIQIDEEGYQNLIESKRKYQMLSPEGKEDLNLLVELFLEDTAEDKATGTSLKQAKCVQLINYFLEEEAFSLAQGEGLEAGVGVDVGVGARGVAVNGRGVNVGAGASESASVGFEERFFGWIKKELSEQQEDVLIHLKEMPLSKLAQIHHKELLTILLKMKASKKQELNQKNACLNMKKQSER